MGLFNFKTSPINEEKKEPSLKETAWSNHSFFANRGTPFQAWNPDQLRAKKGADIYRKMLRDPQVKAAFNLIIDILISREFRFIKPEDTPIQDQIEEFFRFNINSALRGTWTQAMRTILMSKAYGYSVSEKIYCVEQYQGKDHWLIAAIKGKPYDSFDFQQDVMGNIKALIQEQGGGHKKLDPNKFIIHINFPELDPIFGESDLRAAYRPYWEKDNILKFWNIHLERLAGGLLVASPEETAAALSPSEVSELDSILDNVSQGTSIRLPTGWNLDVVNAPVTDAFEKAIAHRDRQIAKSLMVPANLGFSEQDSTGSFAQAKTQLEAFLKVVSSQSDQLADTLNEQLFRELAWWNFGIKEFPRYQFEELTVDQKREIAMAWQTAVEKGVVINTANDESRTRELLLYEQREEDEEPLINPETGEQQTDDVDLDPDEKEETKEEPKEEPETDEKSVEASEHDSSLDFQEDEKQDSDEFINRFDFVEIEQELDKDQERFVSDLADAVDLAMDEITTTIEELVRQAPDKTTEDTADINDTDVVRDSVRLENAISSTTKSQMNQAIKSNLRGSYEQGRSSAQNAVEIAIDGETINASMKSKIKLAAKTSKRLAVKHTRGQEYKWVPKDFAEGLRLDTAEKYFAAKSFEITGSISDDMTAKAKTAVLNGIKNDLSIDEIILELNDTLQPLVGKKDPETGQPDKQERARLETIARTNIIDSFNQANLAVYNDPDLGDFVEAYQYVAILDSRSTDFCRTYNNRIFLKDDDVWNNITPPNHFNCRSTFVPVTVLDEYEPSDIARSTTGDPVQPGNGFGTVKG